MFALEPSAPLLTRVQNELKLDFESLRGHKTGKEMTWKKPGSRRGSAACCLESWVLPLCLPAAFFCLPFPPADTSDGPGRCWGTSVYFGAQPNYPKWGGSLLDTLSLGHKAGDGSQCQQGQEETSSPESECLMQTVFPGYSSATFFPAKMQAVLSKAMPGWRRACFGTCLLISSTRVPLCLPAGQAPSQGADCAGMLGLHPLEWMSFGSFHLEPCVTPVPPSPGAELHRSRADLGLCSTFERLQVKIFSFSFLPPSLSSS